MKQPGLSVTNKEILEKYGDLLNVPEGKNAGNCIVGAVGDPKVGKDGKEYVPITFVQRRLDASTAKPESSNIAAATAFLLGWDSTRILRGTTNASPDIIKAQGLKPGFVMKDFNMQLMYAQETEQIRNNKSYQPVFNPQTGEEVTSDGKPLYRAVFLVKGEAIHQGLELPRDEMQLDSVEESASVEEPSLEDEF